MSAPRRRPIQLDTNVAHDLERLRKDLNRELDSVLAGWSALKADAHEGGWPDRSDGDRKAHHHVAKVCDTCSEKFTTHRQAREHQADTGHSEFTDPNATAATVVWQCDSCDNQFSTWEDFEPHALASGHGAASEVTAGHSNAGRAHQDTTGEAAMQLWAKLGDLDTMQDHLLAIVTSWRALKLVSKRHQVSADMPKDTPLVEPACWIETCDGSVEKWVRGDGMMAYRGMIQINGIWYAKPGEQPKCRRHRAADMRRKAS